MSDDEPRRGTRWGKSALLGLPALLLTCVIGIGAMQGALASHVVIQGGTFDLATSGLYGVDFGLGLVDNPRKVRDAEGNVTEETIRLGRAGFAEGQLNELCLAVEQRIAGQNYTLILTGGDGDLSTWEIDARNVELDGLDITGNLTLDGVVKFGVTAEDITTIKDADGNPIRNPLEADPTMHRFGIDATFAEFSKLTGTVYDMEIIGPFEMPNLGVTIEPGTAACPAPGAPTASP